MTALPFDGRMELSIQGRAVTDDDRDALIQLIAFAIAYHPDIPLSLLTADVRKREESATWRSLDVICWRPELNRLANSLEYLLVIKIPPPQWREDAPRLAHFHEYLWESNNPEYVILRERFAPLREGVVAIHVWGLPQDERMEA